ncbi:MAG: SgcJ/EcaC family oxidoreductase [Candidatus Eisenbacteria bacterium]|nr:SgcJ/EcaC family oxidoreductase [Candidatus Eisenbacteria bacterium]
MRIALIWIALLPALALAGGTPGMDSDTRQIDQLHHEFLMHWSTGDADSCSALFTEDGMRVGARGDIQHGRAEIRAAYIKLFSGAFHGAKVSGGPSSVRMLDSGYALWQAPFTITPAQGPPMEGYGVDLMKKVHGEWRILESHPKLYPPPPPSPPQKP